MQQIELWLICAAVLAVTVGLARLVRLSADGHPLALRAMLGIAPGVLGAVVVLVPRTDLIPDTAEPFLWVVVGAAGSGIALLVATIGLIRR